MLYIQFYILILKCIIRIYAFSQYKFFVNFILYGFKYSIEEMLADSLNVSTFSLCPRTQS
jgi:hypothetical protein